MDTAAPLPPAPAPTTGTAPLGALIRPRVADFVALTKPRVNLLVVATAFGGYYLGSAGEIDPVRLVNTVGGTWLVAASAAALNQVLERDTDALMRRTRVRPLPDGRMHPAVASAFALLLGVGGLAQLTIGANPLAASVALVTLVIYVGLYTPLKRHTSMATLVGGVPGGLPPVIGWAAARNDLALEGWVLFAIVFLWQMPHFLAIAWLCREDYGRANLPMLPVVEPDGRSTASQIVLYAAVLVPVSLLLPALGVTGPVYFAVAIVLGLLFLALGVQFARRRDRLSARHLFLGSIAYLPLLWMVMLLDLR